jgi:hypothetical protein
VGEDMLYDIQHRNDHTAISETQFGQRNSETVNLLHKSLKCLSADIFIGGNANRKTDLALKGKIK